MKIYNSLTNKLEEFIPIKENEVSMYVCGPTVYNNLHIGNSRPVIFFDTVARFFKYLGYKVTYVSNFTDIDDKIIKKALEEGVSEKEISTRYIKVVLNLYHRLNCLPHDANPKVTENMDGIISFINQMVENGGAYVVDGDVYFDVAKIKEYGILSGQTVENLLNGVRIENNDKKHNPIDFTLWKTTDAGVKWDSPWGPGRPGWHTECVVMINNIFKGKIDIHGGGNDLKFPHHDNEIAQSLCVNNHMIANYWIHNGRVDLAGEKMSKSLGNIIWADDLLDEIGTPVYRLMMLNVPYRQLLNYKEELVSGSKADYEKIRRPFISCYRKLELMDLLDDEENFYRNYTSDAVKEVVAEFDESMSNDFNTANAITAIFKMTKLINNELRNRELSYDLLKEEYKALKSMLWVLGIEVEVKKLSSSDKELVKEWLEAKSNKDFEKADKLRNEINARSIEL
ncbi:MAG: cysteine--tRNA ligase [Bacilli bacterium]|nr:cysteine--tRNA ligase [Bacilli bacterium]